MKRWNTDAAGRESSTDPDEGDDGDDVRFKWLPRTAQSACGHATKTPPPPFLHDIFVSQFYSICFCEISEDPDCVKSR